MLCKEETKFPTQSFYDKGNLTTLDVGACFNDIQNAMEYLIELNDPSLIIVPVYRLEKQ